MLAQLSQQRQSVRRLNERLQTSAHDDDEDDEDDEHDETGAMYSDQQEDGGAENLLSDVMMADGPLGLPAYSLEGDSGSLERSSPTETSGLRNRFPTQQETRTALFGNRGQVEDGEEFSEKQLDEQRAEQEDITTDMLALARALKENSVRFSEELQKEKGVLDLATEGLDKNMLGIEGTGRKMGQLRKNDHVGWLWGILYPVIIVALVSSLLLRHCARWRPNPRRRLFLHSLYYSLRRSCAGSCISNFFYILIHVAGSLEQSPPPLSLA